MAVRDFDGASGTRLVTGAGTLSAITPSAHAVSMAFLWHPDSVANIGLFRIQDTGGTAIYNVNVFGGSMFTAVAPGGFDTSPYTVSASDGWRIDVITRAAGFSGQFRWHGYRLNVGTWTHSNGGTRPDPTNALAAGAVWLGAFDNASTFDGRLGAVGVWLSVLSDGNIETMTTGLAAWSALTPDALWALNQTSIATDVTDVTGHGANETADVGTSVSITDDPPGFTFPVTHTLAGSLDGTGALAGTTSRSTASTGGSWYGLKAVLDDARAMHEEERSRPPVACPNDGEPLRTGPNGILYCPYDGWRWNGILLR